MKAKTLQILWHDRMPIYSVNFCPDKDGMGRFITTGGDGAVRIWKLTEDAAGAPQVNFLASLERHSGAVNVARFNPDGSILATAGDDGGILLWRRMINKPEGKGKMRAEEEAEEESWKMIASLIGATADIYDLVWSPKGEFILTGSIDNTARIWHVPSRRCVYTLADHRHYVQGVAWDPLEEYIATQSSDRSMDLIDLSVPTCQSFQRRRMMMGGDMSPDVPVMESRGLYYGEDLTSFFRRLAFTPDGSLLITPAGYQHVPGPDYSSGGGGGTEHCAHVFSRLRLTPSSPIHGSGPVAHLPGLKKAAIGIFPAPALFEPLPHSSFIEGPAASVWAVASQDGVTLYHSGMDRPIGMATGLHYATITDVAWSPDLRYLLLASTDGYCSLVALDDGELGCK
ncbi:WD40-repeat-containing domain protein, partial [Piptocephalis cylindrospora]